jgi:hypothetical protein
MTNIQSDVAGAGAYEHVVVVMSIVLGLAVTQLLKGAAQLYATVVRGMPVTALMAAFIVGFQFRLA